MVVILSKEEYRRAVGQARRSPKKERGQYDSALEREFAHAAWLEFQRELSWPIKDVRYHPLTLYIEGGRYSPDFLVLAKNGDGVTEENFVEVKGNRKQKNYRDARAKLRAAAERFQWWRFWEARKEQGRWIFEEI